MLQVNFIGRDRVRQEARLVLRQRCSSRACSSSRIDGEHGRADRGRRRRQLRALGRRLPPALQAAAAAVPEPAADRDQHPQHAGRAHPGRGLLRGHHQHRAVRRARRALLRLQRSSSVEGHLGFDALFQFSPFYFIVEISASLSVKVFGVGLFSVALRGSRSRAPSPWHVEGTGSISLLFFGHRRRLRRHLGREATTRRCRRSRCMPLLEAELEQGRELAAAAAAAATTSSCRCASSRRTTTLVLHPVGTLQSASSARPARPRRSTRSAASSPADATASRSPPRPPALAQARRRAEPFAPRSSRTRRREKLTAPAFETEDSGLELAVAGEQTATRAVACKRIAALRADHHRQQLQAGGRAAFQVADRRPVRALPRRQRGRRAPSSRRAQRDRAQPFDDKIEVDAERLRRRPPRRQRRRSTAIAGASHRRRGAGIHREPRRGATRLAGKLHVVRPHEMQRRVMRTNLGRHERHLGPTRSCPGCARGGQPASTRRDRDRKGPRATAGRAQAHRPAPSTGDTTLPQDFAATSQLYGPGDVVGVDRAGDRARSSRATGSRTSSPTTCRYIEFYEEDFPWRYTPGARRTRPAPAAAVARARRARRRTSSPTRRGAASRPLPSSSSRRGPTRCFPPADQLWAWAHVHVNRDLIGAGRRGRRRPTPTQRGAAAGEPAAQQPRPRVLAARLPAAARAGHRLSRLPGPELRERPAGRASVSSTAGDAAFFATAVGVGRLRGPPVPTLHPVYHRWYFKTGTVGDFEYLVRLLKPRPPDARARTARHGHAAARLEHAGHRDPELHGVLRLGGALKVPDEALTDAQEQEAKSYEDWDQPYPHAFQEALARVRQPRRRLRVRSRRIRDPDPLITPPLYGRWHALTERLLFARATVATCRRTRTGCTSSTSTRASASPAGFGTAVVQENQEEYMDAAWGQVGDIIEANRRIRRAQVAKEVSLIWHSRYLGTVMASSPERGLALMAPVQRRVVANGLTLHARVHAKHRAARGAVGAAAARAAAARPRGRGAGLCAPRKGRCACSRDQPRRGQCGPAARHADRPAHGGCGRGQARAHHPAAATGGLVPPQSVGEAG